MTLVSPRNYHAGIRIKDWYYVFGGLVNGTVVATIERAPITASVTLRPAIGGSTFRTQAAVSPYGQGEVNHLVVRAFKLVEGAEQGITGADGSPLQKDIPNAALGNPVVFGNLRFDTTYRFWAYAYADAATSSLISTMDSRSFVDVQVARDDRPAIATLPVQLIDKTFSGQATASSIVITGGALIHTGTESIGTGL